MSRIDKYLWSVRVFKTRSDASDACKSGKVKVNDTEAKPSRELKRGDVIEVRKRNIYYKYRVLDIILKRQPASKVPEYAEDITPESELEKLNAPKETVTVYREKGMGRPTKRERRKLDDLMGL
jgi:ribosome-associated heat shock protein Hsp15